MKKIVSRCKAALLCLLLLFSTAIPAIAKESAPRMPLNLTGVSNARELGGLRMKDGSVVRSGALLRTGKLSGATEEDCRVLKEKYHLATIIDFRRPDEQNDSPDPKIDGVRYVPNSVVGHAVPGIRLSQQNAELAAKAIAKDPLDVWMYLGYKQMAISPSAIQAYRTMFQELLLANGKTVLIHCSAGKDRTGVGAALILAALGASRETIIDDFMETNIYRSSSMQEKYKKALEKTGNQTYAEMERDRPGVRQHWIETTLLVIDEYYGSMDHYLHNAMGLSDKDIAVLRSAYLTKA
ncbi:MAG: tyrosine-protein phosphatase [Acutalibacteraceae bacterium]|nr:tyrosine-protein phosphatase [Acutalibacteraceae bacterium]